MSLNIRYIQELYDSNKPLIIYKTKHGFEIFTDFSEKIILNNKNIDNFFNKIQYRKKTEKLFFGYIGS